MLLDPLISTVCSQTTSLWGICALHGSCTSFNSSSKMFVENITTKA